MLSFRLRREAPKLCSGLRSGQGEAPLPAPSRLAGSALWPLQVAAKALETGVFGAYFNVLINLKDVTDDAFKDQVSGGVGRAYRGAWRLPWFLHVGLRGTWLTSLREGCVCLMKQSSTCCGCQGLSCRTHASGDGWGLLSASLWGRMAWVPTGTVSRPPRGSGQAQFPWMGRAAAPATRGLREQLLAWAIVPLQCL